MPNGTLILRADASIAMGTGHVMRCLALAQAWQDQARQGRAGNASLPWRRRRPAAEERIRAESLKSLPVAASPGTLQDAEQLVELALARQAIGSWWMATSSTLSISAV